MEKILIFHRQTCCKIGNLLLIQQITVGAHETNAHTFCSLSVLGDKTQRYPSAIIGDHLFMTVYGKVSFFNNKALSKGRGYVIVCETVSFNECLSHSS